VILEVIAKNKDGQEVFYDYKIYMPQSPAYGRGDKMVYGPHRKSGMLADTSLQPGQWRTEKFEIKFPYEDTEKDGKKVRNIKGKDIDVLVKIWHLPAGGDPRQAVEGKDKYALAQYSTTVNCCPK
jgi:hypothetical protein